jgi:chorismate--pyruvate lyase
MRSGSLRLARWQPYVNGVDAPPAMRHWLTGAASLTAKLKSRSQAFRVECLHQRSARCLQDEAAALGLARRARVWEREVLLKCDNRAVVFAHTVVPVTATAADWPLFSALGNASLGSTLFGDRQVRRGTLEYARLKEGHPLLLRARAALGADAGSVLYARRCLYRRNRGTLLVTEVFLPSILELTDMVQTKKPAVETAVHELTNL